MKKQASFHSNPWKSKPTTHSLIPHQIHHQHLSCIFYRIGSQLYPIFHSILFPHFSLSTFPCQITFLTKKSLRWLVLSLTGYQKQKASLTTISTPKKQHKYISNPFQNALQMESCTLLLPENILRSPVHSHSQEAVMSQSGKTALHSQSIPACYTGKYHKGDLGQFF